MTKSDMADKKHLVISLRFGNLGGGKSARRPECFGLMRGTRPIQREYAAGVGAKKSKPDMCRACVV